MKKPKMFVQLKAKQSNKGWEEIKQTELTVDSYASGVNFCKQLSNYTGKLVRMTSEHKNSTGHYYSPDMWVPEEKENKL